MKKGELESQAHDVLNALRTSTQGGHLTDVTTERFSGLREILANISRSRALQSYAPSETASFVLSLKEPIFERLGKSISDPAVLQSEVWTLTWLIDQLALYTTDVFQDALLYSEHAGRTDVGLDDVRLAIQGRVNHSFTSPPPKEVNRRSLTWNRAFDRGRKLD